MFLGERHCVRTCQKSKVFAELFSKSDLFARRHGVSFVSFSLRLYSQRKAANAKQLRYGYTITIVSFCPVALFLFENGGAREKGRKKRNAERLRAQDYGRVAFEESYA